MPSRVVVTGIMLVMTVAMLVCEVEFFLPLSMKGDMNMACRNTLLKMETAGGLSESDRQELVTELRDIGFSSVSVTGTRYAKQGELLNIRAEAEYAGSRLIGLFKRKYETLTMIYDRSSMSRKVIN